MSYVVWHTQRTGSTLLCTTLEATGIAGHPGEWPEGRLADNVDAETARNALWSQQVTSNGVLGVKWSFYEPWLEDFFRVFGLTGIEQGFGHRETWQTIFPNCHHVVMSRQDKVRLAVSWWKSICGGLGHRSQDGSPLPWQETVPPVPTDLEDAYDFEAINTLMFEAVRREARLRELLTELGASPLTVVYEDFDANYEQTVRGVLTYLGLSDRVSEIPLPLLAKTSDHVNDAWVSRFLSELDGKAV